MADGATTLGEVVALVLDLSVPHLALNKLLEIFRHFVHLAGCVQRCNQRPALRPLGARIDGFTVGPVHRNTLFYLVSIFRNYFRYKLILVVLEVDR